MTTNDTASFGEWVGNITNGVIHMLRSVTGKFLLGCAVVAFIAGIVLVSGEGRGRMTETLRDTICAELGVVLPYVGQTGTMVLTGAPTQVMLSRFYREPEWYYYDKSVNIRNVFCHHIIRARVFNDGAYVLLGIDVSEVKWE